MVPTSWSSPALRPLSWTCREISVPSGEARNWENCWWFFLWAKSTWTVWKVWKVWKVNQNLTTNLEKFRKMMIIYIVP